MSGSMKYESLPGETLAQRTLRNFLDGDIKPASYFRYRDIQEYGFGGVVDGDEYITQKEYRRRRFARETVRD